MINVENSSLLFPLSTHKSQIGVHKFISKSAQVVCALYEKNNLLPVFLTLWYEHYEQLWHTSCTSSRELQIIYNLSTVTLCVSYSLVMYNL